MPSVVKKVQIPAIDQELKYIFDAGLNPGLPTFVLASGMTNIEVVMVEIDNTIGAATVYLKLWNNNSSTHPVLDITPPDMIFPCPALSTMAYPIVSTGIGGRPNFNLGIWYGVSLAAGTGGGGSNPPAEDTDPTIRMLVSRFP